MLGLRCAVQHYDWGSPTLLPELLGTEADGRPCAELWMGAHESAPSEVLEIQDGRVQRGGAGESLSARVGQDPEAMLGSGTVDRFGARLPYLFKVLAVARPLSLQVHPDARRAAEGWEREEASGVPRGSAERSFRDGEHKPELVVALTRFEALSGFRRPERVLELLEGLEGALATRIRERMQDAQAEGQGAALRAGFAEVLTPAGPDEVHELVAAVAGRVATGTSSPRADETVLRLADWFPGDPGAVAALFLNRVTLEPGEAMFVPAGAPHAYLEGCALEAMACSDNVLRAGLTGKHIDRAALLACTVYEADGARLTAPSTSEGDDAVRHRVYRVPAEEFAMILTDLEDTGAARAGGPPADDAAVLPAQDGPRIALCLEGEVELVAVRTGEPSSSLASVAGRATLTHGDVVLLTADDGPVTVRGQGRLATVFVPGVPVAAGEPPTDRA